MKINAHIFNDIIRIDHIDESIESEIKRQLSYVDKSKQYQLRRMRMNPFGASPALMAQLESESYGTLLKKEGNSIIVPSGFASLVKSLIPNATDHRKETGDQISLPWASANQSIQLRPYQEEAVEVAMCHAKGQLILMFDGSLKAVEDIAVNDLIMGPDSKPRKVLKLTSGTDTMYRIIPVKGDPFVVNSNHLLSLRRSYSSANRTLGKYRHKIRIIDDEIVNITVVDYLLQSKAFKHKYKLYRSSQIEFVQQELPLDPYILGLWLGDGISRDSSFVNVDDEVIDTFKAYAKANGLNLRQYEDKMTYRLGANGEFNIFLNNLKSLKLLNNKHIPDIYLRSSPEQRLKLLAGLIDTDGSYYEGIFDITQKNKQIAESIVFIARSLGFAAYMKDSYKTATNSLKKEKKLYYRITITGDINRIPTKVSRKKAPPRAQIKNVLNVGFKVEEVGIGEYYGFTLDSDHLYLMGDFTVSHNCNWRGIINLATGLGKTKTATVLIKKLKRKTLVVCPSKSIAYQFYNELVECFGKIKVGFIGDGKYKPSEVTIGIAASVSNRINDIKTLNLGVIIFDETHHTPANTFYAIADGLGTVGRIYGLTATAYRSDGKDIFIHAACGDILVERGVAWGVANGWLSQPYFIVRSVKTKGYDFKNDKLKAYRAHVLNSKEMSDRIISDAKAFLAAGKIALILVDQIEHGDMISSALSIPFANGRDKGSEKLVNELNEGKIRGLVATDGLVGEGVDTRSVEVLLLANFTASKSAVLQAVGRGLRKTETKSVCIILDYIPEASTILARHARQRISYYKEITNNVKVQ
jgi:intein/homing endonuclease